MRIDEALEQLDAIHEHLTKAEVYRGFTAPGVVLVGAVGLIAAAVQDLVPGASDPTGFVGYWLVVAGVGAAVGFGTTAHAYFLREEEDARRKTRRVFAQFLPCLAAGALITAAFARADLELVAMLPGLWAVVFGLGLIAARPYLPRGVGLVGLGYVLAGGLLLARAVSSPDLSGWAVGGVFGAGHLLMALVLWCDRSRDSDA
jgi:hypothetical protein